MINSPIGDADVLFHETAQEMMSRLPWFKLTPAVILVMGRNVDRMTTLLSDYFPEALVQDQAIEDHSVDIIFANLSLAFAKDTKKIMSEWCRVLRVNGLLILSTLGLDTLKTLSITPQLMDMHDLGDHLLREGWEEPVLDVMHYNITYTDEKRFIHELTITGMIDAVPEVALTTEKLAANYEVIYAHAFAPSLTQKQKVTSDGVVHVPLDQLRASLNK